jgi:crotonobetainyl-CoA:carnitine CoA-transferase CaiB-like acyl-CoA transferase
MPGPLSHIRVLDLSRIMAGPWSSQILADLGADVVKIERPEVGDDTRSWGPPFLKGRDGADTRESGYFLAVNRGKRSVTLDLASEEGRAVVRQLAAQSDIVLENFKVGTLARFGLDYAGLRAVNERLIYCSISGFGQTGPYAPRAGYDLLAQGAGGIMSVTGEAARAPMKVGVGIADVMCGMYATSAILAAVYHREQTGQGQHIDLGLLDTQVAWLVNVGLNYLTSGKVPQRVGNEHPNIVPYNVLPSSDGYFILAVGNDGQYAKFCQFAGVPELAADPRFVTNEKRVLNRKEIYEILPEVTRTKSTADWVDGLSRLGVPCGAVNTVEQAFADPQVQSRGMQISVPHPLAGKGTVDLIGNPIKLSGTPVEYRLPPPFLGQHTDEVLKQMLDLPEAEIARLRAAGVI